MKRKRFVALLLCAVMLTGMIPGNVFYVLTEEHVGIGTESAQLPEL